MSGLGMAEGIGCSAGAVDHRAEVGRLVSDNRSNRDAERERRLLRERNLAVRRDEAPVPPPEEAMAPLGTDPATGLPIVDGHALRVPGGGDQGAVHPRPLEGRVCEEDEHGAHGSGVALRPFFGGGVHFFYGNIADM